MPANFIFIRYGARATFFITGAISALATASIPIVVYWNFWAFVAARFVQVFFLLRERDDLGTRLCRRFCRDWYSMCSLVFPQAICFVHWSSDQFHSSLCNDDQRGLRLREFVIENQSIRLVNSRLAGRAFGMVMAWSAFSPSLCGSSFTQMIHRRQNMFRLWNWRRFNVERPKNT